MRNGIANRIILASVLVVLIFSTILPTNIFAENESDDNKYYFNDVVNAGKDTGYSEKNAIEEKDPHYGWQLGEFYVQGFTRVDDSNKKQPMFLKTVGDEITLWFTLEQDINMLNGDEALSISEDKDGYDKYFRIEETNFGKGSLIIRQTDHQNNKTEPIMYTNYLSAKSSVNANTEIELKEEGDYEVALNYEIKDAPRKVFGKAILPKYKNYRIFFRFSVRNGNSMVYLFDTESKAELTNSASTENGFYLDFAGSHYLDVNIKKEVLNDTGNGLVEDVRFNKPATDGEQYTDEGIYTITVTNRETEQETQKKIYVGTDDTMRASVATGLSIEEINTQVDNGAEVLEDGTLVLNNEQSVKSESDLQTVDETSQDSNVLVFVLGAGIIITLLFVVLVVVCKRKHIAQNTENEKQEDINE